MGRWPLASPAPQGKRSLPHSRCAVRAAAINTPSPALRHFFLPGDAGGGRPERDAGCPPAPQRRARTNLSLILPKPSRKKGAGGRRCWGGGGGGGGPPSRAAGTARRRQVEPARFNGSYGPDSAGLRAERLSRLYAWEDRRGGGGPTEL